MRSKLIHGLEALRAGAACEVMASHLYSKIPGMPKNALLQLFGNFATEAVIAFFVLSGVVIALAPYRGLRRYIGARLTRILPIYFVAIILALAAAAAAGMIPRIGEVLGNLLFLQSLGGQIVPVLWTDQALWSLAYEMAYYVVFPLIFLGSHRTVKIAAAFSLCIVLGIYASYHNMGSGVFAHFAIIFGLYPAWIAGAMAVTIVKRGWGVTRVTALFALGVGVAFSRIPLSASFYDSFRLTMFGLGVAALCLFIIQRHMVEPPTRHLHMPPAARGVVIAGSLGLLWWASPSIIVVKTALSVSVLALAYAEAWIALLGRLYDFAAAYGLERLWLYLGSISYALYAVHLPLLHLAIRLPVSPPLQALVVILATVPLAHFLERVMQPRIKRLLVGSNSNTDVADALAAR